jgi:DNA helicase-2/ATP-dependent DNA helicase PcrA
VSPFVLEALDRPHPDLVTEKTGAEEKIHRFKAADTYTEPNLTRISDDQIIHLSYFQIDDYLTCPLKYKYVHILRVPILPHHTVVYGKALHSAIETYHRKKMQRADVFVEDLHEAYERAWRNIGFLSPDHESRRFEAGKKALRKFYDNQEASGYMPKVVEERFSFILNNNRIEGRWDRVDERNGEITIVDFKSSDVFQQDAADRRAKESLQLGIYALAYINIYGNPVSQVELHFLESGLVGTSAITEKRLDKTMDRIREAASGIRQRTYEANPGYQACRYCAYAEVCPSAIRT